MMFYIGGIGLAVFLNLLLLSKRQKSQADWTLTSWLLMITVHLVFFYLWKSKIYDWLGADMPLPLVHGPMLYLYARSLTEQRVTFKTMIFHLALPLGVLIYLIPFFMLPVEQKIFVFEHEGVGYEAFNAFRSVANVLSGVGYVILTMLVLRKHRQTIVQEFSTTDKINLLWIQYLMLWIALIWIFVIVGNEDLIFACAVLMILFMGYYGIRQVGIFHSIPHVENTPVVEIQETEKPKYSKSGLTDDAAEKLHRDLLQLMAAERIYLNSELTLGDLASRLNTQPNYLSQVINDREKKSFYDFVNSLRIEEFKRKAAHPDSQKYTLLALAQECGFNSKSSFNRYFKKVTGQSPSEFLESVSQISKPAA